MGHARHRSIKSSVSLGFTALAVCFGCGSTFTSAGGAADAGAAGSDEAGAAGENGASTGGGNAAGSSAAGTTSAGGASGATSTGGTNAGGVNGGGLGGAATGGSNASGSTGAAGKPGDCGECLIANQCLDKCGGTVVYTGCCACVPPAVNKTTCVVPF